MDSLVTKHQGNLDDFLLQPDHALVKAEERRCEQLRFDRQRKEASRPLNSKPVRWAKKNNDLFSRKGLEWAESPVPSETVFT
eukprot:4926838-Pyramimonas_sp.AAC.1